jgi:hypothetical protein
MTYRHLGLKALDNLIHQRGLELLLGAGVGGLLLLLLKVGPESSRVSNSLTSLANSSSSAGSSWS